MRNKISQGTSKKKPGIAKKSTAAASEVMLHHLAFNNSLFANIISAVSSGKIISANIAACKLLGYSEKELLSKNTADIFDTNESSFKKMLKQRTSEGHSSAFAINKRGTSLPCQITSAVFMDEDGIEKSITTIADMSQSILKQKNIDNIKERIVAENIVLAIAKQIDIDAKNKKVVAENIVLAIAKQIDIDIKNEKIVADNIALAISNQKNIDVIKEKIVADNIVLAISRQTEIDTKKEKIVADNIMTAQAKSDARLAENNEEQNKKFILAAKLSFDVIWDWNLLTNEVFLGEGFEELYGYALKNNKGNIAIGDWGKYIHPDDKEAVKKGLFDAIKSSAIHWEDAYRFFRADSSIAKVFNRASIFRHADGKAYRMIGALQDITERKKTEQEKELIIKELMKSNADLKQFSYITSHNLRAPLSNIQSILNIIDYSTLDKANEEMLKMLDTSGKQLTKTIEDLTKILVIKNNANAQIRTISLTDAFIKLNNIFSSALDEAGAKVFTNFRDPDIDFNETYFESILINLFSNAIKYRSPDRGLVIQTSTENDSNGNTIFRFSDNGSGIDVNRHKDKLFGLYQRFHDTIEGQGLGLYIIKSQIEALNGTIEIESELDKGTTFIITFKKQYF